MYFQDNVVWITGASSGIGEGLAYALAAQGAKLILSARRVEELERVKRTCQMDPARIAILPLDVTDLDAMPAHAQTANAFFGRIDILVNNAGQGMRGYVMDTDMSVQQRIMQVNYFGTIALTCFSTPFVSLHL